MCNEEACEGIVMQKGKLVTEIKCNLIFLLALLTAPSLFVMQSETFSQCGFLGGIPRSVVLHIDNYYNNSNLTIDLTKRCCLFKHYMEAENLFT